MRSLNFFFIITFAIACFFYSQSNSLDLKWLAGTDHKIDYEEPLVDLDLLNSLKRPLLYLGKGGQMYVFATEDGRYVVKFLKLKFLDKTTRLFGSLRFGEEVKRRYAKAKNLLVNYSLAARENRKNCALCYLHYAPTKHFGVATLIDWEGKNHNIQLDELLFVVQKRGTLFQEELGIKLQRGDVDGAIKSLREVAELYASTYRKGFADADFGVMNNIGFIDGKAFHIDLGKLSPHSEILKTEEQKRDFAKVERRIESWLQKHYPRYTDILVALNLPAS